MNDNGVALAQSAICEGVLLLVRLRQLAARQRYWHHRETGHGFEIAVGVASTQKDLSPNELRAILGEPDRIHGGPVTYWYYPNDGSVDFIRDRLSGWSEPK